MLKTKRCEPDHQLQVNNHSEIGIEHDESVRENQPEIDFRRETQDRSSVYIDSNVPELTGSDDDTDENISTMEDQMSSEEEDHQETNQDVTRRLPKSVRDLQTYNEPGL